MSVTRTYAERACYFSQLSSAARSDEERESFLSIAQGYLDLAKQAARPARGDSDGAETVPPAA